MAGPITWRNVTGPSNTDAFRGMESAQRGIGSSFDMLGKVIADRQAVNQGVEDRGRQEAEAGYLDFLGGFKTPEDLQAARMSGVLDQRLAALDPRNRANVRGAADSLLTSRFNQATAANTFADSAELRAQRPIEEQILDARARGDTALADNLTTQLTRNRGTFVEGNRTAARTRAADDRADVLTPLTHGNAVTAAKLTADLAPDAAKVARKELQIKDSTLTAQGQAATEAIEDRLVSQLTATAGQAYSTSQLADRGKLGALAAQMKLPLDAAGHPDVTRMTNEQIKLLNTGAKTNGLRTTDELFGGDTRQANAFLTGLASDPRITPAGLARNQTRILGAFNTAGAGAAIGNDAANIARTQARADVVQAEKDAANWYAPNSPNALKAYEDLANNVPSLIDKTTGLGTDEDVADIQAFVHKMGTVGLEVRPGKFLIPSVQDMMNVIRTAEGGWFKDSTRATNAEEALKKTLNTSRVTDLLTQAEESRIANRQRAVREILSPTKK